MFRRSVTLLLVCGISIAAVAQKEGRRTKNRRALVQIERAFAKAAATTGTRAAFLEFLADDGIVFQPGPVNGKKFWSERPSRKGLLTWEPIFADVSRAGDLGYTTGPWEFRPNGPDDKPVAFGQYFTIWKKQHDGQWKAVLDRGVTSDKPFATAVLQFPAHDEGSTSNSNFDIESGRSELLSLERELSETSVSKSTAKAFGWYMAPDARVLRQNVAPAIGKSAALALASANNGTFRWQPAIADISRSGDLGYSYGVYELKSDGVTLERGSYVRVWKKQGSKWRIVIDVSSPDPAQ